MDRYGGILQHIAQSYDALPTFEAKDKPMKGQFDGKKFKSARPKRPAEHAYVSIVDIENEDKTRFSCVLRQEESGQDTARYNASCARHSMASEILPKVYGTYDKWTFIERIHGLEYGDLVARLRTNKTFRSQFAQSLADYALRISAAGIELNDVILTTGHNSMIDPETAGIRLVEIDALWPPAPYYEANEHLAGLLFSEIGELSGSRPLTYETDLAFQILQNIFNRVDPHSLFVKTRAVRPGNPAFRSAYATQFMKEVGDSEYANMLKHPELWDKLAVIYGRGNGLTEVFSPELIAAVQNGDFQKFAKIMSAQKQVSHLQDRIDSRYIV